MNARAAGEAATPGLRTVTQCFGMSASAVAAAAASTPPRVIPAPRPGLPGHALFFNPHIPPLQGAAASAPPKQHLAQGVVSIGVEFPQGGAASSTVTVKPMGQRLPIMGQRLSSMPEDNPSAAAANQPSPVVKRKGEAPAEDGLTSSSNESKFSDVVGVDEGASAPLSLVFGAAVVQAESVARFAAVVVLATSLAAAAGKEVLKEFTQVMMDFDFRFEPLAAKHGQPRLCVFLHNPVSSRFGCNKQGTNLALTFQRLRGSFGRVAPSAPLRSTVAGNVLFTELTPVITPPELCFPVGHENSHRSGRRMHSRHRDIFGHKLCTTSNWCGGTLPQEQSACA
jgi:hypothetical protein